MGCAMGGGQYGPLLEQLNVFRLSRQLLTRCFRSPIDPTHGRSAMVDSFHRQAPSQPQTGQDAPKLNLHNNPKTLTPSTTLGNFFLAFDEVAIPGTLLQLRDYCAQHNMLLVSELRSLNAIQLKHILSGLGLQSCYQVLCNYLACQGEAHHNPAVPVGQEAVARTLHRTFFVAPAATLNGPGGVFENFNATSAYRELPTWLRYDAMENFGTAGEQDGIAGRTKIKFVPKTFAVAMLKHALVDYGVVTVNDIGNEFTFVIRRLAHLFCLAYTWELNGVLVPLLVGEALLHKTTRILMRNWRRHAMLVPPSQFRTPHPPTPHPPRPHPHPLPHAPPHDPPHFHQTLWPDLDSPWRVR